MGGGKRFAGDFQRIDAVKPSDKLLIQDSADGNVKFAFPGQFTAINGYKTVESVEELPLNPVRKDIAYVVGDNIYFWVGTGGDTLNGVYQRANIFKGADGADGKDGETPHIHFAYANSADGYNDFSTTESANRAYMGIYADYAQEASTDPTHYTWVRIQGAQGTPSYVHVAYAESADGSVGFSLTDSLNKPYLGIYVDSTKGALDDPAVYKWTLIKGSRGVASYVHVAYANSADGVQDFSTTVAQGKNYLGTYVDTNPQASNNPADYKWMLTNIKTEDYYTKTETDEKLINFEKFDIINKTNGSLAVNGTPFMDFNAGQILISDGSVKERSDLPTVYVSNFFKPTNPRDFGLVRLNNLHPIWDGNSVSKSCNVALYDENKKFVRSFIYNSTAIVVVPFGYYLRTSHFVSDNNISNLVILDPELVAVEDVVSPIVEQVKPILPFFEKFIEIPAEKYVNGGFIGGGGYIVNQEGYSYIIFNVEGHEKIKIHIGKNTMWGAPIWTTYSGLNDGEIDQSLKIRNYVGTDDNSRVAYDAIIELSNNEKYIVIGNSTEELEEYGYSLEYYDGYYKGNSAQEVDERLNEVDERLDSISSIIQNKNVVVLGDSITWQGGVDCTETKGWTYWFKTRTKPKTIKSFAWSGATWTNSDTTKVNENPPLALDSDNTIWQQVRRLIAAYNANTQVKPDMVIIAAGINDVIALNRGERIGCLDKTATQAFADRTKYITDENVNTILTMADAIRYSCELLLETFPNVQIILTTPLQSSYAEVEQSRWESACKIIKDSARYMAIPCIEQGEVCGVYYTQEYTNHIHLSDGLHPNEAGAKKIGNVIASIVNSFVA